MNCSSTATIHFWSLHGFESDDTVEKLYQGKWGWNFLKSE